MDVLNAYKERCELGDRINIALFGLRRVGKTELYLKFRELNKNKGPVIPYLNLQRIVPDVANFSRHFCAQLLRAFASRKEEVGETHTMEDLLLLASKLGDVEAREIKNLANLLARRKIDADAILNLTFSLPQRIADEHDIKIIFILDEFQEILNVHRDVLKIMRGVTEKQARVSYWVAGSVFSLFEEIFGFKNPFFGQFKRMELENFDRPSSYELLESLLSFDLFDIHKRTIYNFTGGQPYYITAVCERLIQEYAVTKEIDEEVVRFSIAQELFGETGKINEHFEYFLDVSLSKFTNKDIYKKILFYLAEKPANLTNVSSHLLKPSGEVHTYMKALLRTDLVIKEDKVYRIREPLFAFWIRRIYLGLEKDALLEKETVKKILADLEEKYLWASSELGRAKEYEVKAKLEEMLGVKLENRVSEDGQLEFDLAGERENTAYIVEIKWRNSPASYKDMDKFLEKVKSSKFASKNKKLYFVSRGGFTEQASKLASKFDVELLRKI